LERFPAAAFRVGSFASSASESSNSRIRAGVYISIGRVTVIRYNLGMARKRAKPRCIIIAGPNGSGKTTFARDYLPTIAGLIHFINADLIATGMSPLRPELGAIAAGRLVLRELDRLAEAKAEFAFESTLSGLQYAKRIAGWKARGYVIEIVYLRLASPQLALSRIAARVRQGGHSVPRADVLRRFKRGWANFCKVYQPLADRWAIYENSKSKPKLLERGP
jgi:predicted ABC-type ATPase